jgi:hypothetical protein
MDIVSGSAQVPSWRFFEDDTVLNRVLLEAPYMARCSDDKTATKVRPREFALRYPYMQVNRRDCVSWLIFDLDHANSLAWDDQGLPSPNLIVRNRASGHSHLYYAIHPVMTGLHAREKPVFYMKAIYSAYAERLKADLAYNSGPVAKTPGHPWWQTSELHAHVYELGELADYVELLSPWLNRAKVEEVAHSRHCILFEKLRYFAYSIVNQERSGGSYGHFVSRLDAFAHNSNDFTRQGFSRNLLYSSLRSTVKSVARWTWDIYRGRGGCHRGVMELSKDLPLSERQRLSAKRTHEVRNQATESKIRAACSSLKAKGEKLRQASIALIAGVTRQTVAAYKHVLKEPLLSAAVALRTKVNYGAHQIPAAVDPCLKRSNAFVGAEGGEMVTAGGVGSSILSSDGFECAGESTSPGLTESEPIYHP